MHWTNGRRDMLQEGRMEKSLKNGKVTAGHASGGGGTIGGNERVEKYSLRKKKGGTTKEHLRHKQRN